MSVTTLTKRLVATAQPKDRAYELRDTQVRGLLLRVQPSGHKAWVVTWEHGKRRTLGSAGHLTPRAIFSIWRQSRCHCFHTLSLTLHCLNNESIYGSHCAVPITPTSPPTCNPMLPHLRQWSLRADSAHLAGKRQCAAIQKHALDRHQPAPHNAWRRVRIVDRGLERPACNWRWRPVGNVSWTGMRRHHSDDQTISPVVDVGTHEAEALRRLPAHSSAQGRVS